MDFEIIYSKRKTLSLCLMRDGRVVVRAPYHTPRSRIDKFVTDNVKWIETRKKAIEKRPTIDNLSQAEVDELKKTCDRDFWLSETEAIKFGVCDSVVTKHKA